MQLEAQIAAAKAEADRLAAAQVAAAAEQSAKQQAAQALAQEAQAATNEADSAKKAYIAAGGNALRAGPIVEEKFRPTNDGFDYLKAQPPTAFALASAACHAARNSSRVAFAVGG